MRRAAKHGTVFVMMCLSLAWPAHADVPLPANMMDPQSAVEAWNVIHLATANLEKLLAEPRLSEMTVQASLCNPALRALAAHPPSAQQQPHVAELTQRASLSLTGLVQACTAGSVEDAGRQFRATREVLEALRTLFDAKTGAGQIFFCPMHPEVISENAFTPCTKCGMKLVARRIPYSFIYVPPGEPTMMLTASPKSPLAPGQRSEVKIRLTTRSGVPVVFRDLMVMHAQPIHLLIVDSTLEDYHHEHPLPAEFSQTPSDYDPARGDMCGPAPRGSGEYSFSFTPRTSGPYRIFADVVPVASGIQEYIPTDLQGSTAAGSVADKSDRFEATAGGMTFKLAFMDQRGTRPKARQTHAMQIRVTGNDGQPMRQLEPFMNVFAHLVGFYDDGKTVIHLHPEGGDILRKDVRGGPFLNFRLHPPKAGFIRLYCQVQRDGKSLFAPFNVNVIE